MSITISQIDYQTVDSEVLIFPVFEDQLLDWPELRRLDGLTRGLIKEILDRGELKGKPYDSSLIHRPEGLTTGRLFLIGAGKRTEWNYASLRKVSGASWRALNQRGCRRAAFHLVSAGEPGLSVQVAAEGFIEAMYESDTYKTSDRQTLKLESIEILIPGDEVAPALTEMCSRGISIGESRNLTRALVNEPANQLPPRVLADKASEMAQSNGLNCTIIGPEEMAREGMGGILAVAQGSAEPPRLIVLEYDPPEGSGKNDLVGLVGKGVTFDTGGISLKPSSGMDEMKADMAGGAAVLGAMQAIGRLRPSARVLGVVPAVENMPGGKAIRPGDVIEAMNGKSIEVANTDAEGRLVLADALGFAAKRGAGVILDAATLTGACKVALGTVYAGLFASGDDLAQSLLQQYRLTGEKLWRLPLDDEYKEPIQSNIADVRNIGNRWGGAIYGAMFLRHFVGETPWAHLDIAGVEWSTDPSPFRAKGPTGFGFRTLLEFVLRRNETQ